MVCNGALVFLPYVSAAINYGKCTQVTSEFGLGKRDEKKHANPPQILREQK